MSRHVLLVILALVVSLGAVLARAGHEIPFYPSFYPQEIKIDVMPPATAARLLQQKSLHAYIGADPFAGGATPAHVAYAESLESYLVLTLARTPGTQPDVGARCAAAGKALKALSVTKGPFVFHPYPVTPYHDDYLLHFDLADAARKKVTAEPATGLPALRVRAKGHLAEQLLGGTTPRGPSDWEATLEEIAVRDLLAERETRMNGWLGPPWLKQGWFQAYLLQAGAIADEATRRTVEESVARRLDHPASAAERANLERKLVATLTRGCERVVVGYTVKRQALNVEYSDGIENIAYDAQAGLASAIFLRDVKLKDFPWNGWLRLGSEARPTSAWNPIAGLADATGRLMWLAVGDPAMFPAPNNGGWIPNRVRPTEQTDGPVEIPRDALAPDAARAGLRPLTQSATATAKVTYQVLASKFHDGTKMSPADLIYPLAFAYRWSAAEGRARNRYDPVVDRVTASWRERLAAVKVLRVDSQIKDYGDVQFVYEIPLVEVYLGRATEAGDAAALAAPWSAIPWQLIALMEEAVTRGQAAFSEAEARRRGVPWLDLVRDRKVKSALAALAETLERQAYVPEALRGVVTVAQARQRWAALRRFYREHGHFLVTNGPYQLQKWSPDSVVLAVFRDLSYPLPVGIYDQYALPLKAYVARADQRGHRLEIEADVEQVVKFERSYRIERHPFRAAPAGETTKDVLAAHFMLLNGANEVVSAGTSQERDGERLVVPLPAKLPVGAYRIVVAATFNGNLVNPEIRIVPYRVTE